MDTFIGLTLGIALLCAGYLCFWGARNQRQAYLNRRLSWQMPGVTVVRGHTEKIVPLHRGRPYSGRGRQHWPSSGGDAA